MLLAKKVENCKIMQNVPEIETQFLEVICIYKCLLFKISYLKLLINPMLQNCNLQRN